MTEPPQVSSSFPLPPAHYYKFYSNDNVAKNIAPKPPNVGLIENYSMFGNTFTNDDIIIRPLESQSIRRLYPQHFDRKKELKKLNHSLLVNFLDLLDMLINAPESQRRVEKIDDLTVLFLHIHHLLNEYRPHQARETLRVMLDLQRRQRMETAKRFNYHLEKVRGIVNNAFSNLLPIDEPNDDISMDIDEFNDNKESSLMDVVEKEDRLMCEIVDEEISFS